MSLYLFPCRDKQPCVKGGWRAGTTDEKQIALWREQFPRCQWGVATGPSGFVVVDVDTKNGGEASLERLQKDHGPLPPTYTVNTPSGGRHLYYMGQSASPCPLKGYPGVDLRSAGAYVIGPYSPGYAQDKTQPASAAAVPSWLTALAPVRAPRRGGAGEKDTPARIDTARKYLAVAQVSTEGDEEPTGKCYNCGEPCYYNAYFCSDQCAEEGALTL